MAGDREALTRAERDKDVILRLYTWDGAWVSLGRFQSPDRDLVSGSDVPWVVRPTGGRAVLHGHDLTVAVAAPLGKLDARSRGLRVAYRAIVAPLVEGLREVGVPAALGEDTPFGKRFGPKSADCFAHVSANDAVDARTGLKVCGCALRLTESAVLLQASIPLGPPLVDPRTVFAAPAAFSTVTLDPVATRKAIAAALVRRFAESPQ